MPGSPYYFGDKSVVIHSSNKTRLTCASFTLVTDGSASSTGSGASPSSTASTQPFEGVAARTVGGSMLALIAAVGGAFFL